MATPPDFTAGSVLTAAQMNAVGLWLVKTQTIGTAVSSVTVSSAFSTDYDQYLITVSGGTASTSGLITMQLGSTTTGYYEARPGVTLATAAFLGNVTNNGSLFYVGQYSTTGKLMNTTLMNPYLSTETRHFSTAFSTNTTSISASQGFLNNTTSYTAFTLSADTGTWTGGTIRVYGYRK